MSVTNLKFSFCIITNNSDDNLKQVIQSIRDQRIPVDSYEMVIVGDSPYLKSNKFDDINYIDFDETIKNSWITRKKNIAVKAAKYDNLVMLHDYFKFDENWYTGMLQYNEVNPTFEILMCKIFNKDGTRYRDWACWNSSINPGVWLQIEPWTPKEGILWRNKPCLVPYTFRDTEAGFISGGFWICKKWVMEKYPLDESLCWAQAEDVLFSIKVLKKCKYHMNTFSSVRLLKQKDVVLPEIKII